MNWTVNYSEAARRDLAAIFEYISFDLHSPDTATKLVRKIINEIKTLDFMPMRFSIYGYEPWHSKNVRFFPVENYLVFYTTHVESKEVEIVRIIYGGRDINRSFEENGEKL